MLHLPARGLNTEQQNQLGELGVPRARGARACTAAAKTDDFHVRSGDGDLQLKRLVCSAPVIAAPPTRTRRRGQPLQPLIGPPPYGAALVCELLEPPITSCPTHPSPKE
jgi:hypothetical protein